MTRNLFAQVIRCACMHKKYIMHNWYAGISIVVTCNKA